MTGSHSRLGISDWESRTTGVTRAYDTDMQDGNIALRIKIGQNTEYSSGNFNLLDEGSTIYVGACLPLTVESVDYAHDMNKRLAHEVAI